MPKKILISGFILFHWFCVAAWLMPKPSPIKTALLEYRLPLPGFAMEGGRRVEGRMALRPLVGWYLFQTAQWQDWAMFAPNPLQVNRYVSATVFRRDGSTLAFDLPRLSTMGMWEAWVQKRWRKYQQNLFEAHPLYLDELGRYLARRHASPDNPVIQVVIWAHEMPIPRHDRPEAQGGGGVDYARLLRDQPVYASRVLRIVKIP